MIVRDTSKGRPAIITGEDLKQARKFAGYTQRTLAAMLRVGERTLQGWENEKGVPAENERKVRAVLGAHLGDATSGIEAYTDAELLLEIARRLRRSDTQVHEVGEDGPPAHPAGGVNEDPPPSNLRYGNTGKPGRRRSQHQE